VQAIMDAGQLVSDDVMIALIAQRIDRLAGQGFILDGFPRTEPQAEALQEKLRELGRSVSAAVLIDVGDDEVVRRLGGRRTCPNGHIFHVDFDPPKDDGVCDVCGEPLSVRDDDKPEVIRHRLDTYHEKTEPLIDYYETKGLLKRVDGDRDPEDVTDEIRATLATIAMEEEA
jgi:adenylate kinase